MRTCAAKVQLPSECRISHSSQSTYFDAVALVSGYHLANEVTRTHDGMMIAIPEDEWVVFHELTPAEMGKVLVGLARNVELERYPKQPHGPKRPKPEKQSGAKIKHVATAKILKARHKRTK